MNDLELLRQFAEDRSESAFATIVSQYSGLVYSVALRQTRNPQLAEDVTQSVFLLLARKARKLRARTVLSGWLFQTTRFVSADVMKSEFRRRNRETQAAELVQNQPEGSEDFAALVPFVNESIGQLKPVERDAVLLRFFEKRSFSEIGSVLGLSEEAARKRVDRAIEKIRALCGAQGIVVSGLALGPALEVLFAGAAPHTLAVSITQAALSLRPLPLNLGLLNRLSSLTAPKLAAGGAIAALAVATLFTAHTAGQLRLQNQALLQRQANILAANQRQKEELQEAKEEMAQLQRETVELHLLRNEVGQQRREKQSAALIDFVGATMSEKAKHLFAVRVVSDQASDETEQVVLPVTNAQGEVFERAYNVQKEVVLDGAAVDSAAVDRDPISGAPRVTVHFNDIGREKFTTITAENINRQLAIFFDGKLRAAPVIRTPIPSGQAFIEAVTDEEAQQIVALVNDSVHSGK